MALQNCSSSLRQPINEKTLSNLFLICHIILSLFPKEIFCLREVGCENVIDSEKQIFSVLSSTCQTTGDCRMRFPQDIWCMIISAFLLSTQFMDQWPLLHPMFILHRLSEEFVPNIRNLYFWVLSTSCHCVSGGELPSERERILENQYFCRMTWHSDNNVRWKAEREIISERLPAVGGCLSVQKAQCFKPQMEPTPQKTWN